MYTMGGKNNTHVFCPMEMDMTDWCTTGAIAAARTTRYELFAIIFHAGASAGSVRCCVVLCYAVLCCVLCWVCCGVCWLVCVFFLLNGTFYPTPLGV